jgi:hypothetical protein
LKIQQRVEEKDTTISNLEKQLGGSKSESVALLHQKEQQYNELKLELEKVILDMVNLYELKLELEKVILDMVNLYELKLELEKVIFDMLNCTNLN